MTCSVDECGRSAHKAGLCRGHYERKREGRTVDEPLRDYGRSPRAALEAAALSLADADSEDDRDYERAWNRLRVYWDRYRKRRRTKKPDSEQSVPEDRTSGRG